MFGSAYICQAVITGCLFVMGCKNIVHTIEWACAIPVEVRSPLCSYGRRRKCVGKAENRSSNTANGSVTASSHSQMGRARNSWPKSV